MTNLTLLIDVKQGSNIKWNNYHNKIYDVIKNETKTHDEKLNSPIFIKKILRHLRTISNILNGMIK